jgi:hypothetical protein
MAIQPPKASTPDLAEHGDALQGGGEAGLEADQPHAGPEQVGAGVGQVVELAVLLAEALDHPHAGDGLVDHAGHLAGALLGVPRGGEDRGAQAEGDHGHDRQGGQHDQGERGRQASASPPGR